MTGAKTKDVCFQEEIAETKVTTMEAPLGSIPGEDVFLARKLSTIEQQRQDQSCLFRRGN
jgi:hypothetical protein